MMMKKLRLAMMALMTLGGIPAFAQDLRVFDLEMNAPLPMRECAYAVATGRSGGLLFGKELHMYSYIEATPKTGSCFQRLNNRFFQPQPQSEPLPKLGPPMGLEIGIFYSEEDRPGILAPVINILQVRARVDAKGNLSYLSLPIDHSRAREVTGILVKKYGRPHSGRDFALQSGYGSVKEYSVYRWEIGKLQVKYSTLEAPYTVNLGSMEFTYEDKTLEPKDKNPL